MPESRASLLQIVQYGLPDLNMLPLLSILTKKMVEFLSAFCEWLFIASNIALCSACIQHVLSVTFLCNFVLSQEHLRCESIFPGGELYPCPITMPHFTITLPHFDREHVDLVATLAAASNHFFNGISSSLLSFFISHLLLILKKLELYCHK